MHVLVWRERKICTDKLLVLTLQPSRRKAGCQVQGGSGEAHSEKRGRQVECQGQR